MHILFIYTVHSHLNQFLQPMFACPACAPGCHPHQPLFDSLHAELFVLFLKIQKRVGLRVGRF